MFQIIYNIIFGIIVVVYIRILIKESGIIAFNLPLTYIKRSSYSIRRRAISGLVKKIDKNYDYYYSIRDLLINTNYYW